MGITAKELASMLNLSESAISLALNNKPGVSTATRRRVLQAAQASGYDFSRKAVLNFSKKGGFCLVVYKKSGAVINDTPFFNDLIDGVQIGCKKEHYDLTIRYLYEDEELQESLYTLSHADFMGIILLATEMNAASLANFSQFKTPIVLLDAYFETLDYNCVLINNTQGAFLATNYLISKRKTLPGYLRSSYMISNFEERADGFYKAIRANGMSTSKSIVHRLTPSQDGAYADMKALLQAGEEPTNCYFADNDHIAIGAIAALKEAGYRIPQDVAVVGFDNLPLCEYIDPPLTTIHVPKQIMGETAVKRLVSMAERKNIHPTKIEIGTELIRRGSV